MGFVGGLLGTAGGAAGSGFAGPALANITTPVTGAQADEQYKNVQDAIQQQKDFLAAVQAQKGLQNQSNVFNQFGDIAAGRGPNPAQAMLNQATARANNQQAAIQAGQRGSSANAGLIARQAAQQGGANTMNAAGEAATMEANQRLNALTSMANIASQQVGTQANATGALTNATQGEQANILNAITGQNNANISRQANVNNINGQLAGITMQGQQNMLGGLMNYGVGALGGLMGAEGGEVDDDGFKSPEQPAPASATPEEGEDIKASSGVNPGGAADIGSSNIPAIQNAFQQKSGGGGGGGGLSSMIGMAAMAAANGGMVPRYAEGGVSTGPGPEIGSMTVPTIGNPFAKTSDQAKKQQQAGSAFGQHLSQAYTRATMGSPEDSAPTTVTAPGQQQISPMNGMARGGRVPALVSPGEVYLSPKAMSEVKKGKHPLKAGEKIPGKPKYPGNDYRNDVVHKNLESGGVVIPNKITEQPKSVRDKKAEQFVSQYLAQGGRVDGMVIFRSKRARK